MPSDDPAAGWLDNPAKPCGTYVKNPGWSGGVIVTISLNTPCNILIVTGFCFNCTTSGAISSISVPVADDGLIHSEQASERAMSPLASICGSRCSAAGAGAGCSALHDLHDLVHQTSLIPEKLRGNERVPNLGRSRT